MELNVAFCANQSKQRLDNVEEFTAYSTVRDIFELATHNVRHTKSHIPFPGSKTLESLKRVLTAVLHSNPTKNPFMKPVDFETGGPDVQNC